MRRQKTQLVSFALALLAALAGPTVLAAPDDWHPLLAKDHLSCVQTAPCRITEKSGARFDVTFDLATDSPARRLRRITKLEIRAVDGGATQSFALDDAARAAADEPFELYAPDLRGTGERALALLSFTSPHDGPLYRYFLYDGATKQFRLVDGAIPALRWDARKGVYVARDDAKIIYRPDAGRGLVLVAPKSGGE